MIVLLEVRSGPSAGKGIRLRSGQSVRVGRTRKSDFMVPADAHLSGMHFEVVLSENDCRIHDLKSTNGTHLNGQTITEGVLRNGDTILAGETRFRVIIGEGEAPTPSAHPSIIAEASPQLRLLALLREESQPLYAILDAGRDARMPNLLNQSKDEHESLYEGAEGEKLAQVAQYLVRLEKESLLLSSLVLEGWGKGWGVYLTFAGQFQDLRRHLRQFLEVPLPDGKQVYFRFYDPPILRAFLPTCSASDAAKFFGPIAHYLLEDESPEVLLQFTNTAHGVAKKPIVLSAKESRGNQTIPAVRERTTPLEQKAIDDSPK
jgi:hypothetical protein